MSSDLRQSKNERRDAAREKARQQRERQQRREKRSRLVLQLSIGVVLVAIVAVVAVILVNSIKPAGPGPRNMADGGITIAGADLDAVRTAGAAADATPSPAPTQAGAVKIQIWEDFGCPYCNQFETANGSQIKALVTSGAAVVQYFPVAILDRSFTDQYSTRAANAAAAVANYSPDAYDVFHTALYAAQPEEGGAGLSDDRIIAIAKSSGVTNLAQVTTAIRNGTFENWVHARTDEFSSKTGALTGISIPSTSVGSTPTVLVNGQYYTGQPSDSEAFGSFVTRVGGTSGATTAPSASPSPSASE